MAKQTGEWQICSGRYGRGYYLARISNDSKTDVIAPPGVPLDPPEHVEQLLQWRNALYEKARGKVDPASIAVISLQRAIELAPEYEHWIREKDEEQKTRDLAAKLSKE